MMSALEIFSEMLYNKNNFFKRGKTERQECMLDLVSQNMGGAMLVVEIFICLVIILVEIPLHECAHGWVAKALGDPTPEESGRLSLNPFIHLDIMGTLAVVLFGFGWGKPMPVNPHRCSKVKPRVASALISLSGPLANLIIAYLAMIIEKLIYYSNIEVLMLGNPCAEMYLYYAAVQVVNVSIYLAVFNLLPIPPFDGSRFFLAFLPTKLFIKIMKRERVIMIVIMLLFLFGIFSIPMNFLSEWISKGLFYATGYVEFFMGI